MILRHRQRHAEPDGRLDRDGRRRDRSSPCSRCSRDRRRRASGLVAPPLALDGAQDRRDGGRRDRRSSSSATPTAASSACPLSGVPWVVPIVLGFVVAWTLPARAHALRPLRLRDRRQRRGRAARRHQRATRIRVLAFTFCRLTAGAGGIIYASRLGSISSDVDGGTLVLYAVAAAVIGGTSLFGGRGKMIHAAARRPRDRRRSTTAWA